MRCSQSFLVLVAGVWVLNPECGLEANALQVSLQSWLEPTQVVAHRCHQTGCLRLMPAGTAVPVLERPFLPASHVTKSPLRFFSMHSPDNAGMGGQALVLPWCYLRGLVWRSPGIKNCMSLPCLHVCNHCSVWCPEAAEAVNTFARSAMVSEQAARVTEQLQQWILLPGCLKC